MSRCLQAGRGQHRARGLWLWCALHWLALGALPVSAAEGAAETEGIPAIATRDDVITEIRFVGNKITRERILRQYRLRENG